MTSHSIKVCLSSPARSRTAREQGGLYHTPMSEHEDLKHGEPADGPGREGFDHGDDFDADAEEYPDDDDDGQDDVAAPAPEEDEEDEDDDEEDIDPSDVEDDLEKILRDRIAAGDDEEDEDDAAPSPKAARQVAPLRSNEWRCDQCFMIVGLSQFGSRRDPVCPSGEDPCASIERILSR